MSIPLSPRAHDPAIRATGLILAAIGTVALVTLYRAVHTGPVHETGVVEFSLAAIGFVGLSLGSALLTLGAHIWDPVMVSHGRLPRIRSDSRFE